MGSVITKDARSSTAQALVDGWRGKRGRRNGGGERKKRAL